MEWERQVVGITARSSIEEETHDLSNRLDAGYNCREGMIGERLRHYEILKRLGAGGQATAYLARDTTLHRTVVLKLLDPRMAEDELTRKRFLREARLAATLNHPNICTIHELGEDRGYHFIVMEYVEGESLKALLERKRLAPEAALAIALQIADGLAAAHRAGIVHRDLKTANIIIARSGRPVILDFGLAKALPAAAVDDLDLTQASALGKPFGTASYMSPEQARGELTIDARSDVFSFGIILYEMLTGRKPFVGKGAVEIMHAILHDAPRPICQFMPTIDPELEEFIMKTLKKRPEERYASGVELLEHLTAVAARLGLRDMAAVQALVAATQERASLGRQLLGSLIHVFQSMASFIERLGSSKERPIGSLADRETGEAALSLSQTRAKLTLAILPLKSLTRSPAYEHFGVGLA
ncbi:MAG: serine/threonine protein kinase, partial [Acidobacteria bacterium]